VLKAATATAMHSGSRGMPECFDEGPLPWPWRVMRCEMLDTSTLARPMLMKFGFVGVGSSMHGLTADDVSMMAVISDATK